MNKTLSPKLQEVVFEVPDDNTETVTDYMRLLVNAEDNLDFPAAYTNYSCFFCAIRTLDLNAALRNRRIR